jgi:hypothetical protein
MKLFKPALILATMLALPAIRCPAMAEQLTVNGYDLNLDIETRDKKLMITGYVSGGEPCSRLQLKVFCRGPDGRLTHLIAYADKAGEGKRSVEGVREFPHPIPSKGWVFDEIYTECVGR